MSTSTSTQKTNVLEYEYDYFTMYSSMSTITLECNHDYFHDYFHEYPVSNIKATFMESQGVILFIWFKLIIAKIKLIPQFFYINKVHKNGFFKLITV